VTGAMIATILRVSSVDKSDSRWFESVKSENPSVSKGNVNLLIANLHHTKFVVTHLKQSRQRVEKGRY
jgi:hypothetical protein